MLTKYINIYIIYMDLYIHKNILVDLYYRIVSYNMQYVILSYSYCLYI